MEVNEQAERVATRSDVRNELGEMDIAHGLDGLEFDDERLIDDEVGTLTRERDALVGDRDLDLLGDGDFGLLQFVEHGSLVEAFEKSGAQMAVDLDRAADHAVGEIVELCGNVNVIHRHGDA